MTSKQFIRTGAYALGSVPKRLLRRFSGLFWPIFDSNSGGSYSSRYDPPNLNRKSAQKNPKIDRRIFSVRSQIIQGDRILLSRKTAGPHIHLWDLPGGGIEFSEAPIQTLHRELLEETALQTTDPTLLTILSVHGEHHTPAESYRYHHLGIIYRLHNITPTQNTPEEETRWFPLNELDPAQITPFVQQLFEQELIHD